MPRIHITRAVERPFQIGFDMGWDGYWSAKLLGNTDYVSLQTFFAAHNITHVRFPGENSSQKYFFRDKLLTTGKWYSDVATDVLTNYFADKTISPISVHVPDANTAFLKMVQGAQLVPIIPLNCFFYIHNSVMYPMQYPNEGTYAEHGITGLEIEEDRFTNATKVKKYIVAQADAAHNYAPLVKWELGNEMYYWMGAAEYAEVVINLISYIEAKYPNDKFIVSLSKGMIKGEHFDRWNDELLTALNAANFLSHIDEFAVHFYPSKLPDYVGQTFTQGDIETRVEDTYFNSDVMVTMREAFNAYEYTPKFSLTEFSIVDAWPWHSSQLHALLMIDALMKFRSEADISSCTKHTGLAVVSGCFLQQGAALQLGEALSDALVSASQDSLPFPYVYPHAKIAANFFQKLADNLDSYSLNAEGNGLEILTTKLGDKGRVFILNYKDTAKEDYDTTAHNGSKALIYTFPNLAGNTWDEIANTTRATLGDSLTLPPHSLTIIMNDTMFAATTTTTTSTTTEPAP